MNSTSLPLPNLFVDTLALVKPRITALALVTAFVGMCLAPVELNISKTFLSLLGIGLLVGGANVLNMFLERDTDLLMKRTQDRPLPQQRLSPDFGLGIGSLLVGVAIPLLMVYVNPLTGWLGVLNLGCYVIVYTYLKRVTWLALLVGAIPGASPPLLGWTAATGSIGLPGLILFGIIYLWQVPHFLAIGLFHQEEYAKAGLKLFPLHHKLETIQWQMTFCSIPLIPLSLALYFIGFAGRLYFVTALGLGILFLASILQGVHVRDALSWGRQVFRISLLYLVILFGVLLLDGGMR